MNLADEAHALACNGTDPLLLLATVAIASGPNDRWTGRIRDGLRRPEDVSKSSRRRPDPMLNQIDQHVEDLWLDCNQLAIAPIAARATMER